MFRTVPLSIIRNYSLYTQQWCMSYRFADSLRAGFGRNCPKHVWFYSKNKFDKLVHLVGFIVRSYKLYTTVKSRYKCRMRCSGLPVVLFSNFRDNMTPVISLINIFLTRSISVIVNNYHSSCRLIHEFET